MSLSLAHARGQVLRYRATGWFLRTVAFFGLVVWMLRNIYEFFRFHTGAPLFGNLYAMVVNLIVWIYHTVPGIPGLWGYVPVWNVYRPLAAANLPDALYFGFCFGLGFWGTGFLQAASSLSRNITRTEEYIQRQQWLEAQRPAQKVQTVNADTFIQTQLYLSSEDKWWTRPKGILGLAIIGAVIAILIAQWLMLRWGWVH